MNNIGAFVMRYKPKRTVNNLRLFKFFLGPSSFRFKTNYFVIFDNKCL